MVSLHTDLWIKVSHSTACLKFVSRALTAWMTNSANKVGKPKALPYSGFKGAENNIRVDKLGRLCATTHHVCRLQLGLRGAALAYVAEEVTAVLLCVGLIVHHNRALPPHKRTWDGFSVEAFRGWGRYLQVSLGLV